MSELKQKTDILIKDLLDPQMKQNIEQFLYWAENRGTLRAWQDFLDFLFVAAVQEVLEQINVGLYDRVVSIAEAEESRAQI